MKILPTALCLLLATAALPASAVESIPYQVIGKLPHSRGDFVQGLEIRDGLLYQGTGLVGRSGIQVFDLASGKLVRQKALPPPYFGEGITVHGERVIQLTWQARKAFVFDRESLARQGSFSIPGQGWGLTNNGSHLIYSDGSPLLRFISTEDWRVTRTLKVLENGRPVRYLNELEWTAEGLLANIWRQDRIVRIDLDSGDVTGEIDLTGLLPRSDRRPDTDVLNGVAHNAEDGTLWVTGKNWPWLYQLKLLETPDTGSGE